MNGTNRIERRIHTALAGTIAALLLMNSTAFGAKSRIKDIARIAGLDDLEMVGYGVIIGLNGSGDKDIKLTKQTMANLLEHFNISLEVDDIKSKNVAAVVITATAHPFHQEGDKINARVSSIGDASSLEGGILLMTPLLAPDGSVYAIAQGSVTLGGFSAGGGGAGGMTVTRNHTTSGLVPAGVTLKYGQPANFYENGMLRILLRHPDFTTADRMADAVNEKFGGIAVARDAATVVVKIPQKDLDIGQAATFIASIERLTVQPDIKARVIINERTGTIVMGGDVHISSAVVAHGNLTVTVKETLHPSHPENLIMRGPQPGIRTVITPDTEISVKEDDVRIMVVPQTTTVQELADALNVMGATPRDLISILEALHKLGALQMELTAM